MFLSASWASRIVLQVMLRMEKPPQTAGGNLDWLQNLVSVLEGLLGGVEDHLSLPPGSLVPTVWEQVPKVEAEPKLGRGPLQR